MAEKLRIARKKTNTVGAGAKIQEVSISTTFYVQLFYKMICKAFMWLQFVLVFFGKWHKAAHKMLVKLITEDNEFMFPQFGADPPNFEVGYIYPTAFSQNAVGIQVSISSTFYKQLLHVQISKSQKNSHVKQLFVLLGSPFVKAAHNHVDEIDPRCCKTFSIGSLPPRSGWPFWPFTKGWVQFLLRHICRERIQKCLAMFRYSMAPISGSQLFLPKEL